MEKKVLWGILLAATALILVSAGVYAVYSDTETASTNTFSAGTLNLQVGSADTCTESISVSNIVPGNTGSVAGWLAQNTGNVAGDLTVAIGAITNNENSCGEPEVGAGDTTSGATDGEMGANLQVAFWIDVNSDGTWNSGDYYLKSDGTTGVWASGTTVPAEAFDILNDYGSRTYADVQTELGAGNIGTFRAAYDLPVSTTGVVQSDSAIFDITFTLDQH